MTYPSGPGSARSREDEILSTALDLFFEHGYRAVGLRELSSAIGLNIGTIYHYFKNKDAILLSLQERGIRRLLAMAEESLDGLEGRSATERLRALVAAHLRYHTEHYKTARLHFSEYRSLAEESKSTVRTLMKAYERQVVEIVDEGICSGEFAASSAKIAAFAVLGAGAHVAYWYRPDGDLDPEEVARTVADLVMNGVKARAEDI